MKKIAIVGAGWCGIGCLKGLLELGYENIDVYEVNDDVGGVWHPSSCYWGLSIHSTAATIEYHDFPLPSNIDRIERIKSEQVYNYISSYCKNKDLYKYMKFNCKLQRISYNKDSKETTLSFKLKN